MPTTRFDNTRPAISIGRRPHCADKERVSRRTVATRNAAVTCAVAMSRGRHRLVVRAPVLDDKWYKVRGLHVVRWYACRCRTGAPGRGCGVSARGRACRVVE